MNVFGAVFHAWFSLYDVLIVFLVGVLCGFVLRGRRR